MTKIIGIFMAAVMAISAAPTPTSTIPSPAGYEYDVRLSEGSRPETDAYWGAGEGAFAVFYENGRLTGRGDAALFNSFLNCDGTKYTVHMCFYQHEGLFFSEKLQELLNSLCYLQYGEKIAEPEEKYGLAGENTSIVINGRRAEDVRVIKTGGNGHIDFVFEITDIPMYQKYEIESISFSVGNTAGMEPYDITFRETGMDEIALIAETLKKYPEDFMQTACCTEDYAAVYIRESPPEGGIKDRLYLINRETKESSEDILDQVRQIKGFSSGILNPFAFKVGEIKTNFFFSCGVDDRTGDFCVDTKTGIVHTIAVSEKK